MGKTVWLVWTCGGGEPGVACACRTEELAKAEAERIAPLVRQCCKPWVEEVRVVDGQDL